MFEDALQRVQTLVTWQGRTEMYIGTSAAGAVQADEGVISLKSLPVDETKFLSESHFDSKSNELRLSQDELGGIIDIKSSWCAEDPAVRLVIIGQAPVEKDGKLMVYPAFECAAQSSNKLKTRFKELRINVSGRLLENCIRINANNTIYKDKNKEVICEFVPARHRIFKLLKLLDPKHLNFPILMFLCGGDLLEAAEQSELVYRSLHRSCAKTDHSHIFPLREVGSPISDTNLYYMDARHPGARYRIFDDWWQKKGGCAKLDKWLSGA